jgi:hypothetical protein
MTAVAEADRGTGRRRTASGLERRGLVGTGVVLAIILFYAVVLPLVDAAVPLPGTHVEAGTVVNLAGRARFTPASSWKKESGSKAGQGVFIVSNGGVEFRIAAFDTNEKDHALLTEFQASLRKSNPGAVFRDAATFTTSRGLTGVSSAFTTVNLEGFETAFSRNGTGVLALAIGPTGGVTGLAAAVNAMFDSIEIVQ